MTNNSLLAVDIRSTFFGTQTGAKTIGESPGSLISNLLPNIIVLSGVIFFLLILYSGFHIISDAGSQNAQNMAKHRSMITIALVGFLIVVSSYFILQLVLANLGLDNIINNPAI